MHTHPHKYATHLIHTRTNIHTIKPHARTRTQMRRQAELSAALQVAWQQKQEAEEKRRAAREAEMREVRLISGQAAGVGQL